MKKTELEYLVRNAGNYLPHSHLPVYFETGMVLYEKARTIDAEGGFYADISCEEFQRLVLDVQKGNKI